MSPARIIGLVLLTACMRGDASALTFEQSANFVIDHIEGTALVANDCGHGPSRFGINAAAHPGVDVAHLTREHAIALDRPYWDGVGADRLPEAMKLAAYDAALNMGVSRARILIAESHGDVSVLLKLRERFHAWLARTRPACAFYRHAWAARDRLIALASRRLG